MFCFVLFCFVLFCLAWLGLAWLGLAWLGFALLCFVVVVVAVVVVFATQFQQNFSTLPSNGAATDDSKQFQRRNTVVKKTRPD